MKKCRLCEQIIEANPSIKINVYWKNGLDHIKCSQCNLMICECEHEPRPKE